MTPFGARVAHTVPTVALRRAFAMLLVLIGFRMLI